MSQAKDRRAKLAGRTTEKLMEGMIQEQHRNLERMTQLVFEDDDATRLKLLEKLLHSHRVVLRIYEQLKSGDYHAAEETINTKLLP